MIIFIEMILSILSRQNILKKLKRWNQNNRNR